MKEIELRIAELEKRTEGQARRIAALESLISILVATHAINSHGDDDSPGIEASLLFKAAYRELQAHDLQTDNSEISLDLLFQRAMRFIYGE